MRIHRANDDAIEFRLTHTERDLLKQILRLYPVVPGSHAKLSKSLVGRAAADNQKLLDEALAEQRARHKRRLDEWLDDKSHFRQMKSGCVLKLLRSETEWLLQVLNDIRVGNWLLLGSPEERTDPDELAPQLQRVWAAMEISGMFQMTLLQALDNPSAE